jgi:hypothetical protein
MSLDTMSIEYRKSVGGYFLALSLGSYRTRL